MAFQKVEYNFPDEESKKPDIEIEDSSAVEIDVSGKKESLEFSKNGKRVKNCSKWVNKDTLL